MAERFGPVSASFWEWDDPAYTVVSVGGATALTAITSAEVVKRLGTMTRGRFTLRMGPDWEQFLVPGRIVSLTQFDRTLNGAREMGALIVEKATPRVTQNGQVEIGVTGLGRESLLTKYRTWAPVGEETTTTTTLEANTNGPREDTLTFGAPGGADNIVLDDGNSGDLNQEIRITMSYGAGVHVTRAVDRVLVNGYHNLILEERLPAVAEVGSEVVVRHRDVALVNPAAFVPGVEALITLDNDEVQAALVEEGADDNGRIWLRDGLTHAASTGNQAQSREYTQPAADDVEQIMSRAAGWELVFENAGYHGTAAGTTHQPKGESVWELLTATAAQSGEFFRGAALGAGGQPRKKLEWRRTHDSSGITLLLPATTGAADTATENVNQGVIHEIAREREHDVVTRIYPSAADGRISLALVTAGALANAAARGFSVHVSGDLYEPDYVEYDTGVSQHGVLSLVEQYGNIMLESEKSLLAEIQAASDSMLLQAMNTLLERQTREYWRVKAHTHRALQPGQTVVVTNNALEPEVSDVMYVLEVRESIERGVVMSHLLLSMEPLERTDAVRRLGKALTNSAQAARRGGGQRGQTVVLGGGGSGEPGAHDHTDYLRADGARTLTGNLAASAGITIDGVDVSAHAANAGAHHPAATAADGSIAVNGSQGISIAAGAAGDGLSLSAGAMRVNTANSAGTQIISDAVGVLPSPTGGLQNTASGAAVKPDPAGGLQTGAAGAALKPDPAGGLQAGAAGAAVKPAPTGGLETTASGAQVKRPANSGVGVGAGGVYLNPATVSAASANSVSGDSHTHEAGAAADARGLATLLESDAGGGLALTRLGVGRLTDTAAAIAAASPATDDYTLLLKQIASQTAELLRVESAAGSPLIRLTGGGDLESGTPAFVSGQVGWQITADGNAEFNNAFIRGELHAVSFVADEIHATGGTLLVATSAVVAAPVGANDNKMGALNATFTLNLQASWDTGASYVAVNDILRWKSMGAAGSGLDLWDVYMQVTAIGALTGRDLANGNPGWFAVTVNRRNGGAANLVIPTKSAVVKWGKIGGAAGSYTGGLLLTADLSYAPYIDIFTVANDRTGAQWSSPPAPVPRVRLGNLRGVLGKSADEWGLAAGTNLADATTAAKYLVASDAGISLRNIDLEIYSAAERVIRLSQAAGLEFLVSPGADVSDPPRRIDFIDNVGISRGYIGAWSDDEFGGISNLTLVSRQYSSELEQWIDAAKLEIGYNEDPVSPLGEYISLKADDQITLNAAGIDLSGDVHSQSGLHVGLGITAGFTSGVLRAASSIYTGGGLVIGNANSGINLEGALSLEERTVDPAQSAGWIHVYGKSAGGVQKLYARFGNGVIRELASA